MRGAWLVSLLFAGACIWQEPVNVEPTPTTVDVAPVAQGFPIAEHFLQSPNGPADACSVTVAVQVTFDATPPPQVLYAQIWLNDYNSLTGIGTQIVLGGQSEWKFTATNADDPTSYRFTSEQIDLSRLAAALNSPDGDLANTLTVFVSDAFASSSGYAPAAGHYTTSWYWQLPFLSAADIGAYPQCASLFQ